MREPPRDLELTGAAAEFALNPFRLERVAARMNPTFPDQLVDHSFERHGMAAFLRVRGIWSSVCLRPRWGGGRLAWPT